MIRWVIRCGRHRLGVGLGLLSLCLSIICLYFWVGRERARKESLHLQQRLGEKRRDCDQLEQEHLTLRANFNEVLAAEQPAKVFSSLPLALSNTYKFSFVWIDIVSNYQKGGSFEFAGGYNSKTRQSGDPFKLGFALSQRVAASGKTILCKTRLQTGEVGSLPPEITTLLSVPLSTEKRCWGVLHMADEHEHPLSHSTLEDLKVIANLVSMTVDNLRANQALRIAESESRAMNAMFTDALVTIDSRGIITSTNANFDDLFGFEKDEVVGQPMSIIMPEKEADRCAQILERYQMTGERQFIGVTREINGLHRDGHLVPMEITVHETSVDGRTLFSGLIRDISERKASETLLEDARGIAQKADMARNRFLANMNHALRTPLSGIVGMADLLMETPLQDEQKEYITTLMESAQGLLENLDGMMECAKIGEHGSQLGEFEPRAVLDELGDLLAPRVRDRTVEIYLHIHPELPPTLTGSRLRLSQTLLHMTTHVLRGVDSGVMVLGAAPQRKGRHHFLHFWVRILPCTLDTDMIQALVDQPIAQALDNHNMAEGCFNLHLAQNLAHLLGGHLAFESDPQGGTLSLKIPMTTSSDINLSSSILSQARCLILANHGDGASALESLVHAYGCCPEIVQNADSALALLKTGARTGQPFHLLILPYKLPNSSEMGLLQGMREDSLLEATRIMVHAPLSKRKEALSLLSHGATFCLTHPIKQKRLVELLLKLVKERVVENQPVLTVGNKLPEGIRGRILLVEDNEVNQKLMIKVLEKEGCDYVLTGNGKDAVSAATTHAFDLILMDINLPLMNGIDATRFIRAEGMNMETPIIAMTADVINTNLQFCLDHKMNGLLTKPLRVYELVSTMRQYLNATDKPNS